MGQICPWWLAFPLNPSDGSVNLPHTRESTPARSISGIAGDVALGRIRRNTLNFLMALSIAGINYDASPWSEQCRQANAPGYHNESEQVMGNG